MEVEMTWKGSIKPSSPTPPHLQTYKISLLDQFSSPIYFSFSLFYPQANPNPNPNPNLIQQTSITLKHSLSETLSRFYPLAGKIKDRNSINCDDGGASYTQAYATISLPEFLQHPDITMLHKLVPDVSLINRNPIGANVLLIQETTFSCGGLAIGISVSHTAADGISLSSFIKAWSATAFEQIVYPDLDSPIRFPLHEEGVTGMGTAWMPFLKKGKLAVRRLLFDAKAVAQLKKKVRSSELENPSRIEVVSAVIAKSLMAASNAKSIAINHNVNMRPRANPPLPNCSLGNFIWTVCAICGSTENEREMVLKLRNAIRKIDGGFVEKLGFVRLSEVVKEMGNAMAKEEEFIIFSSWCKFGLYDIDFGWGKPVWMAHCSLIDSQEITFMNMAYLNDTVNGGDEVEVWLYVTQDVAAVMESDAELLQYVSVNPSPLEVSRS